MFQVHNLEHLRQIYQQATRHGLEVMLQEIIPGEDSLGANYNAYWWDGRPLVEFTAQKIRNGPPKWGSPRVVVSRFIPQVLEAGRSILQEMNFYGYTCTEFKQDPRDGIYKLMEVNGRHNLSTLLAVKYGINFPWLHYRHLVYDELPCATEYRIGTFWIDLIRDVGYSIKSFRQENISLAEYVRPYWHPHVFAVFDRGDLKPFIKRCVDVLKPHVNRNGSVIEREKAGGP
jgi:predicted ATP-grasp superfamily ATP-dependent carboligase